ncbi:F-box/FBD/LRR-repeat protein At1g16930-like [Neltuma alba]|uniref:F-box/FBD/LRR-repeat protein At1g16930-like n=1 Tax=Neltuma alba TaxID=207710 RepID=UPI0010A3420B|nr:F-box/FBD/LRR-repeat protein At1g16930-like [Prosopis alba]XP_028806288.1 F-box/FBD/LRR-repeat protein At1g16930-like [Prosopis alba]
MSDLIENLPDILLLHILSFLPTKEAVATSILSKRWRPFWQSLPILAIRDVDFHAYDLEVFVQFVDDVLLLGNLKFLNTFSLTCWTIRVPYEKLSSWINALIQSRVESIEIWFPSSFNTKLPSNMFNSKTMKVLKLNGITFDSLRAVSLPCLTVLYFDNVRCADLNCVAVLVSGCPILETLVFKSLDTKHYGPMLDVGKLDHLVAARVPPSLLPWKALANVRFLSLRSTWIPGAMHAAWSPAGDIPTLYNLTYLECYSNMWTRMVNYLHSFPKLQNLVISEV